MQQFYPQIEHDFKYELNKDMHFAAAHFINHESAGACQNVHGHTYFVNITVAGDELDDLGFLVNFKLLKDLVHKRFDHTLINNDSAFKYSDREPTTEEMAELTYNVIQQHLIGLEHEPKVLQVIVRETPTSYVIYRGGK